MEEIFMNLVVEVPTAAVAIYAIRRMSHVMVKLSEALTIIATKNSDSLTELVDDGIAHRKAQNVPLLHPDRN